MHDVDPTGALGLLVRRLSRAGRLGETERAALLALPGLPVTFKAHAFVVQAGAATGHSCLVADGLVARLEQLEDGRRQIVSLHLPGDLVDLASFLLPGAPMALLALASSTVVKVPHGALHDLVADHPGAAMALWRDSVLDASLMAQAVVRVGRHDAYARVAHLLCEMLLRYQLIERVKDDSFRFPATQEQLADVLGLTSVHINRTLRALREDGLVRVWSSKVEVLDRAGLLRAGEFDPTYLQLTGAARRLGQVA